MHLLVLAENVQVVEINVTTLAAMFQIVHLDLRLFVLRRGISHVHLHRMPIRLCGRSRSCPRRAQRKHSCECCHFGFEKSHIHYLQRVKSAASMPRRSRILPTIILTRSSSVSGR